MTAEFTKDRQPRVILKLHGGRQLFGEPDDRNTYKRGSVHLNKKFRGSVASQEIGLALAELYGVKKIQFRYRSGVFVNIDTNDVHLEVHLRRIARALLDYSHAFSMRKKGTHPTGS